MRRIRDAVLFLFALLALLNFAWGQGAVGTLNGTVTDQAGAVVPGATVVATNQATGVETKTQPRPAAITPYLICPPAHTRFG